MAEDRVLLHPAVIGEVLLGGVDLVDGRLGTLRVLPAFPADEVVSWLRRQDPVILRGVGWADCVIAHAALTSSVEFLTSDESQRQLYAAPR